MGQDQERRPAMISIHALRKESDHMCKEMEQLCDISIHALRKESDASLED